MKKKILSLMLAVFMCLSVLTGCSLVTRNDEAYYNAVVASITYSDGTKEEITKRELLTAYYSYGYNYTSDSYGYTLQGAIELTIDSIVDNYVTRKAVKDYRAENDETLLNENETTYLWVETYDAIFDNLKSYLSEYEDEEDSTDDSEDEDSTAFSDYEATIYLDGTTIKRVTSATTIRSTYEEKKLDGVAYDFEYIDDDGKYVFQELMYQKITELFAGTTQSDKNWKSAYLSYIKEIKENYSYMSKSTNKEWFLFEMNRVYEILKNNYLVEVYETIYNTSEYNDENRTAVQAQDVLQAYLKEVKVDYTTYSLEDGSDTYDSDVMSSISDVYYHLTGEDDTNYFYIAPIKIANSDEMQAKIDELENRKTGMQKTEYDALVETYYSQAKEKAESLVTSIKNSVNAVKNISDDVDVNANNIEIGEAIRDYFYNDNDDDTYKNADYNPVYGVSADGKTATLPDDDFEDYSDVTAIEDAIIALYNDGDVSVGDVSSSVQVDDGYYIFVYVGKVENLIADPTVSSLATDFIKTLAETRLNIFSSKTILDVIYDDIATDNFTTFKNLNIENLKGNSTIERYTNNIKDLYE